MICNCYFITAQSVIFLFFCMTEVDLILYILPLFNRLTSKLAEMAILTFSKTPTILYIWIHWEESVNTLDVKQPNHNSAFDLYSKPHSTPDLNWMIIMIISNAVNYYWSKIRKLIFFCLMNLRTKKTIEGNQRPSLTIVQSINPFTVIYRVSFMYVLIFIPLPPNYNSKFLSAFEIVA